MLEITFFKEAYKHPPTAILFFQLEFLVSNPFFLPHCYFKIVNKTQNHEVQVVTFLTKQLHITLKAKVNSLCFVSKLLVPPCCFNNSGQKSGRRLCWETLF